MTRRQTVPAYLDILFGLTIIGGTYAAGLGLVYALTQARWLLAIGSAFLTLVFVTLWYAGVEGKWADE